VPLKHVCTYAGERPSFNLNSIHDMKPSIGITRPLAVASLCAALAACGGQTPTPTPNYTVGGQLTGTPAASVVLLNNGADPLTLDAVGSFTFPHPIMGFINYSVTIQTQPAWQTCTVSDGTGAIAENITDVDVDCSTLDAGAPATIAAAAGFNVAPTTAAALTGVATDGNGNDFAVDSSAGSVYEITGATVTSLGTTTGAALANSGSVVAYSKASSALYVGNPASHTIVKFTASGGTYVNAGAVITGVTNATGIAVDASGNIYVVDAGTGGSTGSLKEYSPSGGLIATLATASASTFVPVGVAVDASGNVYATDLTHGEIFKISGGTATVFAGSATTPLVGTTTEGVDGIGAAATFNAPTSISVDTLGNLYVLDSGSGDIRQVSPAASVVALTNVDSPVAIAAGPSQAILVVTNPATGGGGGVAGTGVLESISPQ
jgi:sugar lactone lactonase YvrE